MTTFKAGDYALGEMLHISWERPIFASRNPDIRKTRKRSLAIIGWEGSSSSGQERRHLSPWFYGEGRWTKFEKTENVRGHWKKSNPHVCSTITHSKSLIFPFPRQYTCFFAAAHIQTYLNTSEHIIWMNFQITYGPICGAMRRSAQVCYYMVLVFSCNFSCILGITKSNRAFGFIGT